MHLFHPRIIKKHIKTPAALSTAHADILNAWAESLAKGAFNRETSHDGEFIQRILIDVLGYTGSSAGAKWTASKNQPIGSGNVDVALGHFSAESVQIVAPFELKGAKTRDLDAIMPGRNKSPVQQAWEYAMDAKGAKWVLVSNYREIRLYAIGYGRKDYERFDLSQLTDPASYARFMLLLSAENLLGERVSALLKESENKDKEITDKLYLDYKTLRSQMINTLTKDNPSVPVLEIIQYTQTILDRILFVAFAEDRGLLPDDTLKSCYEDRGKWNPQPAWENFKGLFHSIDKGNPPLKIPGYNGGLFAKNDSLNDLNVSDTLCEGFKTIGSYDFESDVSVNILGHIFEQSITDLEEIKASLSSDDVGFDKKKSKRKKDGIFYTPPYITRYIVEQAVGGWLNDRKKEIGFDKLPVLEDEDYESIQAITRGTRKGTVIYNAKIEKHIKAWEAYKAVLSDIKVLDPACGSGAFLNEVFDYLYREGQVVNSELATLNAGQEHLFRWDTHILANNIYGVDINQESVEITKLSLWLKTANRNEKLTYLDDNIKCGNSLIDDPAIAGDLAFKWEDEFPQVLSSKIMFDTNIFNRIVEGKFDPSELKKRHAVCATTIQFDELSKTGDEAKKKAMLELFDQIVGKPSSPESSMYGVGRFGVGKYGGNAEAKAIWTALEALKKNGKNFNHQKDALIADTCLKQGHILVTEDQNLYDVAKDHKIKVLKLENIDKLRDFLGFDVVVGNPPYIPIEMLSEPHKEFFRTKFDVLERKYDSSVVFILHGLALIKNTGYLSYISSVTWQTGENYPKLRGLLVEKYGVKIIVNLPFDIFPDAYVETCAYILSKHKTDSYKIFCFDKNASPTGLDNLDYQEIKISSIQAPDFKLVLNSASNDILDKIKRSAGMVTLGQITRSTQGLSASRYELSATKSAGEIAFLTEGTINRYRMFPKAVLYTNFRQKESLRGFYSKGEKLLIRRIINRQDRIMVAFTEEEMAFTKDANPFIVIDNNYKTKYLLSILASKLISYLYVNGSSIATKDDFRQTTLAELRAIHIKQISSDQQQPFIEKAEIMLVKNKELHDASSKFLALLKSEFGLDKLSGKLEQWYKLDFAAFIAELTKKKITLTLAQKAEWMEHFEKQKASAAALKSTIDTTDREIDLMVYNLYGLTADEIAIVEGAEA